MRILIPILSFLTFVTTVFSKNQPTLSFEVQLFENGDILSAPRWTAIPDHSVQMVVAQEFKPNDSLGVNLGVEVESIYSIEDETVIYAIVFRLRELEQSKGDPETALVATFKPQEYFLTGKMKIGSRTEFPLKDGKTLKLINRITDASNSDFNRGSIQIDSMATNSPTDKGAPE